MSREEINYVSLLGALLGAAFLTGFFHSVFG